MTELLFDSREQAPLEFKEGVFDEVSKVGLPVGDYWLKIDGKEVPICIERKGLGDLFGTMGKGYPRFKRELTRCQEFGMQMIMVIEGSMREVFQGFKHSTIKGETILKKLAMLRVRYDMEYHFFNDRREMARFIEDIFSAVARNWSCKS